MDEKEKVVEETTNEQTKVVKQNNKKGLLAVIGIIVVLVGILYFAYTKLFNPKNMFIKSINKGYAEFEEKIDEYTIDNKESKPIMISNDINVKLDVDKSLIDENTKSIIDEINKINIKNEIGYDQKNKTMLLTLDALYDKEDLLNVGAYAKDEKMYFELKNLFDKYIEVPLEDYEQYFETNSYNLDKEELKYLLSKTKDAVLNNLNSKDFKKSSEKITVNKKELKVTKITYSFSEKSASVLAKSALEDLKKDSKYIKILSKLMEMDEKEVREKIDESIKNIKTKDLDTKKVLELSVFVKGISRENAGYELRINDEDDSYTLTYYKNKEEKEIKVNQGKESIVNATVKDDKATIKMTAEDQEVTLTIKKSEKKNVTTYNYDLEATGSKISGKLEQEKIKENKDGTGEYKTTLQASMMGLVTFEISDNIKIEYKDKIKIPDTKNSISYEELSEEDMNSITTKLYENEALMSLMQKFSSYSNTSY